MGVLSSMAVMQMSAHAPCAQGRRRHARDPGADAHGARAGDHASGATCASPSPAQRIEIVREEVPGPATTPMWRDAARRRHRVHAGRPASPTRPTLSATPAVSFGVVTNIKFSPDGTLVNQDGQSRSTAGLSRACRRVSSVRAVTVLGSTGRIRGYRWDGTQLEAGVMRCENVGSHEQGFSLIEVMFALGVLDVGVLGAGGGDGRPACRTWPARRATSSSRRRRRRRSRRCSPRATRTSSPGPRSAT